MVLVRISLVLMTALFACSGSAAWAVAADFRPLLRAHVARYPQLEALDLYKFLFQACLGAEHAAPDEASARAWLEREVATMGEGPAEPITEPLTPDGSLVRVHLRPFVQQGGDVKRLARAFRATAQRKFGSRDDLAAAWRQVEQLTQGGELKLPRRDVEEFGRRMNAENFPAVRHSEKFRRDYRPAYRIVARDLLGEILPPAPESPRARRGLTPSS